MNISTVSISAVRLVSYIQVRALPCKDGPKNLISK